MTSVGMGKITRFKISHEVFTLDNQGVSNHKQFFGAVANSMPNLEQLIIDNLLPIAPGQGDKCMLTVEDISDVLSLANMKRCSVAWSHISETCNDYMRNLRTMFSEAKKQRATAGCQVFVTSR